MALDEQMQAAIQEDIADTRSKEDRLKDQMEGLTRMGVSAVASPILGAGDIVDVASSIPEMPPKAAVMFPTIAGLQSGFNAAKQAGLDRKKAEELIEYITGVELQGDSVELFGEIVGIPGGASILKGVTDVIKKYGDAAPKYINKIKAEAKELFRTASVGDDIDGMATATAGASRETVPTSVKPDLPDTSISPSIIEESTPSGSPAGNVVAKTTRKNKSPIRKLFDKLPQKERNALPTQPDENRIFGYHGTARARERDEPFFDINFARKNDQFLGEGFYFTLDPEIASEYSSLRAIGTVSNTPETRVTPKDLNFLVADTNIKPEYIRDVDSKKRDGFGNSIPTGSLLKTPEGQYYTISSLQKGEDIYGQPIAKGQSISRFDLSNLEKPYVVRTKKQREELQAKIPELKKEGYDSILFADFKDRSKQVMVFPEHMDKINSDAINYALGGMALNEQMRNEAIKEAEDIDTGVDTRTKKERIRQQMDDLKSVGRFVKEEGPMFVAESTPGLGEAIAIKRTSDALDRGDKVGAGIEALAGLAGLAPAGGDLLAKTIRTFKPKKTVKAYKLFTKGKDGNLYPLFVDADTPVRQGEFIDAVIPKAAFKAPNGKFYVPSKGTGGKKGTGDSIKIPDDSTRQKLIEEGFLPKGSKAKTVKAVAMRPGWHAGDSPAAPHIGNEYKGKKYRSEDQVWAEVEMPADTDWQTIANSRASIVKSGKRKGEINVKEAEITDQLPDSGFYRYKTNPNMQGNWLISGQMKVNRVLDADEVKKLNKEAGTEDLPTLNELKAKDMAKGGTVMDDYQFAELKMDKQQKFSKGGMSKQMKLFEPVEGAFDEGGLMQEGGTVDPESGNEVPVGSTQEEVRDDIPAQLSEGEFVFPADVVRYIGLEKLMQMRQEAKRGLEMMDKMGQMGNSDEAVIPDDVPFDMSDLDMEDDGVLEFQTGGFVQPQGFTGIAGYQPSQFTGYTPQFTPYTPAPMPTGQTMAQQYTPAAQQFTPTIDQQAPTFTNLTGAAQPSPGGYDEMRTYVNDAGMEMQIPFKDGSPIYPIPEGYKVKGEAVKTTTDVKTETTQTTAPEQQDSGDEPSDPFQGRQTVRLGGTVVTKDMVDPLTGVLREGLSTYRAGTVKGSQEYVLGTASSKTRPTGGSGSIITDMIAGAKDTVKGILSPDQITLTNKGTGVTVAMTKDLYQEIIADKFGADREKMLSDIFTMQAGLDAKDGYSKDVDNRMAENLAKQYGIEYKGQSVAQLTAVDIPAATNKAVEKEELEAAEKAAKKEDQEQKAKETGDARRAERAAAASAAAKLGISDENPDGSKKTTQELINEMAAENQRRAEERQRQQMGSTRSVGGGDSDSEDYGGRPSFGGSVGYGGGVGTGGGVGESFGSYGGFAKGGLAQQMKQSGLASKK